MRMLIGNTYIKKKKARTHVAYKMEESIWNLKVLKNRNTVNPNCRTNECIISPRKCRQLDSYAMGDIAKCPVQNDWSKLSSGMARFSYTSRSNQKTFSDSCRSEYCTCTKGLILRL